MARILVVEDERDIRENLTEFIRYKGYDCIGVDSGEETLPLLGNDDIDIIMTDLLLPGMTGIELVRHLRKEYKNIIVIIITGNPTINTAVSALRLGVFDYLIKPFSLDEFNIVLNRATRFLNLQEEKNSLQKSLRTLEHEILLAQTIQDSLLMKKGETEYNLNFSHFYRPAHMVGGDFFDYIPIDDNIFGIAIGDVAGKGVPAAFLMAITKILLRREAQYSLSPREILQTVNNQINSNLSNPSLVTLFYCIIDQKKGTLTYCNAGHEPPLLYNKKTGQCVELFTGGVFLGPRLDLELSEEQLPFSNNNKLLFYTDGLLDIDNTRNMFVTIDMLKDTLAETTALHGDACINYIINKYSSSSVTFSDDVTLLLVDDIVFDTTDTGKYVLRFPNFNSSFSDIRCRMQDIIIAEYPDVSDDAIGDIFAAFEDAISNIALHAYEENDRQMIHVFLTFHKDELTIDIRDFGKGFNLEAYKEPLFHSEPELLKTNGRGIFLMKMYMDNFTIHSTLGLGTELCMKKRLSTRTKY